MAEVACSKFCCRARFKSMSRLITAKIEQLELPDYLEA